MNIEITKIANTILYMLDEEVLHLNDRKLSILLFLIDYENLEKNGKKIFNEKYIKQNRNPEPKILSEIFGIIANGEDLDEEDERLYLITDMLDFLDIEILTNENFIELKFLKMEEDFDASMYKKEEFETIKEVVKKYKNETSRKVANACFKIDKVRETQIGEIII